MGRVGGPAPAAEGGDRALTAEDRKRSRAGPAGARSEDVTSGAAPLPGEGRGLRLVQPGGRKKGEERRWPSGRALGAAGLAPGRRGSPPWSLARPARPPGPRRVPLGAHPRPARGAQRLCSVLQVYPEPRSEGECLSNIREFLRGCGASLRLEVSGGGAGAGRALGREAGGRGNGPQRRRPGPGSRVPQGRLRAQGREEPHILPAAMGKSGSSSSWCR